MLHETLARIISTLTNCRSRTNTSKCWTCRVEGILYHLQYSPRPV